MEKKVRRLLGAGKGLPEGIRGCRIRGEREIIIIMKKKGRTKIQCTKIE